VSFLGPCCPAPLHCIAVYDCLMLTERINDDDDDDDLKGRCHGNKFSGKNGAKLVAYPLHLSLCQSKTEWDIATSVSALTAQMMPLYSVEIS